MASLSGLNFKIGTDLAKRGEVIYNNDVEEKIKALQKCFLYLITDGNGNYKIGISVNPIKRLNSLNTSNPDRLTLLLTAFCRTAKIAKEIEENIHLDLGEHREVNGEWYKLTRFDLFSIAHYFIDTAHRNLDLSIDEYKFKAPPIEVEIKPSDKSRPSLRDVELIEMAKEIVKVENRASASLLQRKLSIGYARSARILDVLENEGIVSKPNGQHARIVSI